ncbi:MAG TPA: hypothetical protein V6D04_12220, partial [Candidatus Obscuribacterales bacterium]
MRRLVVISSRKSKMIAISVGVALSLTSIHLAATARIATLKREQEQLEKTFVSTPQSAVSNQPSAISQISNLASIGKNEENAPLITKPSAPAESSASPARRQIVISIADRKLALLEDGKV